jgi:hypothetical protein
MMVIRRFGFCWVVLIACAVGCGDDDADGALDAGSDSGTAMGSGGDDSSSSGSSDGSGGDGSSSGQNGSGGAKAGGGSGGGNASNGSGGATGSGGRNGGNGTGGMGGFTMMPVMCGDTTCTAPIGARLPSCCLPDMTCGGGFMGECQPWQQSGTLDASCPSHMTQSGSMLGGCCKPGNQCGVMSQAGLGCVERTKLAMFAGGPLDAIACGGDGDNDAGADGGQE